MKNIILTSHILKSNKIICNNISGSTHPNHCKNSFEAMVYNMEEKIHQLKKYIVHDDGNHRVAKGKVLQSSQRDETISFSNCFVSNYHIEWEKLYFSNAILADTVSALNL